MSERGFYRIDEHGDLQYAPNAVYAPGYTLRIGDKLRLPLPDGWLLCECRADAEVALGVKDDLTAALEAEGITDAATIERVRRAVDTYERTRPRDDSTVEREVR
jgi:hypothetical protein